MSTDVQLVSSEYINNNSVNSERISPNSIMPASSSNAVNEPQGNNADDIQIKEQNLKKKFLYLFAKRGISVNDDILCQILKNISGKSLEDLLNSEDAEITEIYNKIDQFVIEDALKMADRIVAHRKYRGETITKEEAIAIALVRSAKDYKFAEDNQMNIEDLRRQRLANRAESIGDRISNTYKQEFTDWNALSIDEKKSYILKYFTEHFRSENIENQMTDFNKLLLNTPAEDRELFLDVINTLSSENRCRAASNVLYIQATPQDSECVAARLASYSYVRGLALTPDDNGRLPSRDDLTVMLVSANKHLNQTQIGNNLDESNKIARDLFANEEDNAYYLKLKQIPFEELSPKDQQFVRDRDLQAIYRSSQIVGLANSDVIDYNENREWVESMLKQMNVDAYDYANPVYYDTIQNIIDYVEEHPETLNMDLDAFNNLMEQVIGENYSIVREDLLSGSNERSLLTEPDRNFESPDSTPRGGFGFNLTGNRPMVSNPSIDNTVSVPDNTEVDAEHNTHTTADSYFADGVTVNKVMQYFSELGSVRAVQEILNSNTLKGTFAEVIAWYRYGISSPEEKLLVVEGMNYGSNKTKAARQLGANELQQLIASSDNIQEIQTYEDLLQTKRQENNLLTRIGNLVTK